MRFYENKKPLQHCFYKDGKIRGEYKTWYEDGAPMDHRFYKNGKREGECLRYHNNKRKAEHGFYKDDELEGERMTWYDDGSQQSHVFYKNGKWVPKDQSTGPMLDAIPKDKLLSEIPYRLTLKGMSRALDLE